MKPSILLNDRDIKAKTLGWIIAEFALLATFVIATSWIIEPLTLTPDSRQYLELAEALSDSPQTYMTGDNLGDSGVPYFAVWPVGYPAIIATASKVTGLSFFWASKFANILIAVLLLAVFILAFGNTAPVYASTLLFSSYIKIFIYTWSESLFILFLVIFTLSLSQSTKNSEFSSTKWMIATGLAALGLFLSRYIGIFAIGMMWLMCGYLVLVQKKLEACIKLACISLAILSFESAYLYNNWIQTGHITGIDRVAAPETNIELLNAFASAVWLEMLFTISDYTGRNNTLLLIGLTTAQLIFFIYCIDLIWKAIRVGSFKIDHTSIMFFLIGSSYFLAITALRWISDFDHFNYRLFAPATLLVLIGITRTVELSCTEKYFSRYSMAIVLAAITSIVISIYDINFVYQFTRY